MWRHLLNETAGNLWRHREGNLLSLATISASLFTFSLFLLLITNLGAVIGRWSEQIQVSVFLADEADSRTTETLTRILRAAPEAESFEFVSKEEALERFRADFSRLGQLTGSLEENPLPASFEVRVAAGFRTPEAVAALAGRLKAVPGVPMVRYDFEWIRKLNFLIRWIRYGGWSLAGLLILASVVAISNAISLSLFSRRSDIEIMRLVGATSRYIRGPFLLEGAVQGGAGASLALGFLYLIVILFGKFGLPLIQHPLLDLFPYSYLPLPQWIGVLAGGVAMGLAGSLLSVRRFSRI
ncbi:MAG: permease-like cell division protein FtsX [Acidobacteria bacterium]|nr:permease-like cell division protein FtsX [Acidobacteriota bacterium]